MRRIQLTLVVRLEVAFGVVVGGGLCASLDLGKRGSDGARGSEESNDGGEHFV